MADRGADIYEFLKDREDKGHGFVVRSAQDRGILDSQTGEPKGTRLFEAVRQAPSLGGFVLELGGRKGREARSARPRVSALPVILSAPQRPGHPRGSLPPVHLTAVRVWEEETAASVAGEQQPLEWILLTEREMDGFEAAREVARWYSTRWIVEEFHKALKSGLGAEKLQLEEAPGGSLRRSR